MQDLYSCMLEVYIVTCRMHVLTACQKPVFHYLVATHI